MLVHNILPEERCRRQFSRAYMAELTAMGLDIYHPIGPEIAMFRVFNTVQQHKTEHIIVTFSTIFIEPLNIQEVFHRF